MNVKDNIRTTALSASVVFCAILSLASADQGSASDLPAETRGAVPAAAIIAGLEDDTLRRIAWEVLNRNPALAAAAADARAADTVSVQRQSLPDPTFAFTWFALSPQTRVGPQQASMGLSQRLPWFGKLDLEGKASFFEAVAASARVEALRVELLTRLRTLYQELIFEDVQERIIEDERAALERFEELARARYASGAGDRQAVVKLQAEITRADSRQLSIRQRQVELVAAINALRDLPSGSAVHRDPDLWRPEILVDLPFLRSRALLARPEMAAAEADLAAAEIRVELAGKRRSPDVTVGLNYGFVGRRDDAVGEAVPPQGNGDDILALTGGINLPIWSRGIHAAEEEAVQRRLAAEERRRAVVARIEGELGDVGRRIPIMVEQLDLFEQTLLVQARESLLSAETAYASGRGSALDLFDAERTLYEVRLGAARTRADLEIARARLEGVIAGPLEVKWGN